MQENWIGKSRGMHFRFALAGRRRGDRGLHDAAGHDLRREFVAVSPDHPIAQRLRRSDAGAAEFIALCKQGGTTAAELETAEKLGFDTGLKAVHPLDPAWELPVYIANFVLMEYGTGAIFGVPAHDQRDFEFASKYGLPIRAGRWPSAEDADTPIGGEAESGDGVLVNSRFLDGMDVEDGQGGGHRPRRGRGLGRWHDRLAAARLGVSRQRYWGTPIPIIHCAACGPVPVPKDQLPVVLPEDVDSISPATRSTGIRRGSCRLPGLRREALRETDTLDTFVDSSWYFIRFASQPETGRST